MSTLLFQSPRATLTIDAQKILKNLSAIKQAIVKNNPSTDVMAVMKANAYGLGLHEVVSLLLDAGIQNWGIASAAEAVALHDLPRFKKQTKQMKVYLLGNALKEELPSLIATGTIFGVSSLKQIKNAATVAKNLKKKAKLQLLFDTGMGRLGFPFERHLQDLKEIQNLQKGRLGKCIAIHSIYSHFASSEKAEDAYTLWQWQRFQTLKNKCKSVFPKAEYHLAASFGIAYSLSGHCLARIGIAMYGYGTFANKPAVAVKGSFSKALSLKNLQKKISKNFELLAKALFLGKKKEAIKLQPEKAIWQPTGIVLQSAVVLKAAVTSVRWLKKGSFIGYDSTFCLKHDGYVATLAAGYADGIPAGLRNCGEVLLKKNRYPIIGKISMDYTTLFIGDGVYAHKVAKLCLTTTQHATFLGKEGSEEIKAEDWSRWAGISLQCVLTGIGQRVERVFLSK